MANWFDPASPAVRGVLTAVMLGSLLMAAALPEAFGERALLFAASYVALQVGRNAAAACAPEAPPPAARRVRAARRLERRVRRAVAGRRDARRRPAARCCGSRRSRSSSPRPWPATGCRVAAAPSRPTTTSRATHFAERCQVFIIIALGESIVVTGATASDGGTDVDGRALPRRRVRRDRGAVVAVLRRDGRARARHDQRPATTPAASRATPTPTCTCRSSRASSRPRSATTCSSPRRTRRRAASAWR